MVSTSGSASSSPSLSSTAPSTPDQTSTSDDHNPMDAATTTSPSISKTDPAAVVSQDSAQEEGGGTKTLRAGMSLLDLKSFSTNTVPKLGDPAVVPPPSVVTKGDAIRGVGEKTDSAPIPAPPLFPRSTAPPSSIPTQGSLANNGVATVGGALAGTGRPPVRPSGGVGAGAGSLRAGVRGAPMQQGGMKIPPSLQAKMAAMASRSSSSNANSSGSSSPGSGPSGTIPHLSVRPSANPVPSRQTANGPAAPSRMLSGGLSSRVIGPGVPRRRPGLNLSSMGVNIGSEGGNREEGREGASPGLRDDNGMGGGTPFSNFRKIVDPSGRLNFASKAVVHADGVDFSSGASFKIKMDDFELYEELGKGNYGTVQKVWHKPTKVTMALKEIRLELDDSKLKTIITELDILHRATSPYIIDFYGAFFIESCVYYCMEYMDAGSLEKVAGCDVPEDVLSRVTRSMVEGLKFLKDELKIMHRDVKPTNVLINRKGFVKLCDFGVSGQLDRSLAKTNIGCQSYMAPERIKGESQGAPTSYTASSDVWSLGLSVIEFAIGHYPYPPETYSNVFAQLTAIVHGEPPRLPSQYSDVAQDFVAGCLIKTANRRPTYAMLMEHPFLKNDIGREVDMVGWIAKALDYREKNPKSNAPALA